MARWDMFHQDIPFFGRQVTVVHKDMHRLRAFLED